MNRIFQSLVIVFFSCSLPAQDKKQVLSYTNYSWFDEELALDHKNYTTGWSAAHKTEYRGGKRTRIIMFGQTLQDTQYVTTFEYEDSLLIRDRTRFLSIERHDRIISYEYLDGRNLSRRVKEGQNGEIESEIWYEHSEENLLIEEYWYNGDGTLNKEISYSYDSKGQLIERLSEGILGSKGIRTYEYDSIGNVVKYHMYSESLFEEDPYVKDILSYYDEEGNIIKEEYAMGDGIIRGRTTFEYKPELNSVILTTTKPSDDNSYVKVEKTINNEFGDRISFTRSLNGLITTVSRREIEYAGSTD